MSYTRSVELSGADAMFTQAMFGTSSPVLQGPGIERGFLVFQTQGYHFCELGRNDENDEEYNL
jgi:hypothetical protein